MANELITREDIVRGKQNIDALDKYLDGDASEQVRLPSGKSIKTRAGVEKDILGKLPADSAAYHSVGNALGNIPTLGNEGLGRTGLGGSNPVNFSSLGIETLEEVGSPGLYYLSSGQIGKLNNPPSRYGGTFFDLSYSKNYSAQLFMGIYAYNPDLKFRICSDLNSEAEEKTPWIDIYHSANTKPYQTTTATAANVVVTSTGELQRSTSSRVFKDDIKPIEIDDYRTALRSVQPVSYRSKYTADNPKWTWYSFIAEDMVNVDPRLVQMSDVEFFEDTDEDGNKFVNSRQLPEGEYAPSGLNFNGIVTLMARINQYMLDDIEALEAEKTQLKSRMTKLENRLEALEKQLAAK